MSVGSLTFGASGTNAGVEDTPDGVRLRGRTNLHVCGPESEIDALTDALGTELAARVAQGVAFVHFGNAVGRFRVADLGTIDVHCGKWSDATFDAMLHELTEIATGLPFAASQSQSLPYDRSLAHLDSVLFHAFLYVRHIVLATDLAEALMPTLDAILRDPHRQFVSERERSDTALAHTISARTLDRLASGAEPMARAGGGVATTPLAVALRGHVPISVEVTRARSSVDTPENRFVSSFLKQITSIVDRAESVGRKRSATTFGKRTMATCAEVRRVLARAQRHDLWDRVGTMTHLPIASTVLQRRREYRDVLRHSVALRATARLPLNQPQIERLLGIKDVALLYELWVFYRTVRAVESVVGRRPDRTDALNSDELQVNARRGLRVAWGRDIEVIYNLSFSRSSSVGHQRSTSLTLRPDVVVVVHRGSSTDVHVLDAKLKLAPRAARESVADDSDPRDDEDEGESDSPTDASRGGTFIAADVVKMHAYRDALPSVRSAFVVYPGGEGARFPADDADAGASGVGAVPLVPGGDDGAFREHVRWVLD